MRNFILGFVAFPLLFDWIPRMGQSVEQYLDFLRDKPLFILLSGPVVLLLLIDWDWRRNLSNRYAQYQWERKQRLLKRLQRELGGQ